MKANPHAPLCKVEGKSHQAYAPPQSLPTTIYQPSLIESGCSSWITKRSVGLRGSVVFWKTLYLLKLEGSSLATGQPEKAFMEMLRTRSVQPLARCEGLINL